MRNSKGQYIKGFETRKRTQLEISCNVCQRKFFVQPHTLKNGRKKYCSKLCWSKGIFTPEVRAKMSAKRKGKPTGRGGEKCYFWKGGITPKNKADRMSLDLRNWRNAVYERDKWTCQLCLKAGGRLNADHIKPFSLYPELRFAIDNGRTLCEECHRKTDTYGGKMNRIKKI